jgi:uncharacterized protein YutE (UPF0331/DUF86 family)
VPNFQDIAPKLERLSSDHEKLEAHRLLSREESLADPDIQAATCYLFLTAIQECIDVGAELIAILGLRKPVDNADVFVVLGEGNILPPDFVARLKGMVGFRNTLTHRYRQVDMGQVYDNLQNHNEDFLRFMNFVIVFIERDETHP